MSRSRVVFGAILCWSLFDVLISLLLYVRFDFDRWNLFANGIFRHRVASSPFDVFLLAVLRSSLIIGCTLGRAFSRDRQAALKRLTRLTPLVAIATIIFLSYFVVKFLISKEYDENGRLVVHHLSTDGLNTIVHTTVATTASHSSTSAAYHPWLWAMLGWSTFATGVAAGEYYLLCRVKEDSRPKGYQMLLNINSPVDINSSFERDDSDDGDNDDGNETSSDNDSDADKEMQRLGDEKPKKKKKSLTAMKQKGTVWRLLKMSKPDIGFILTGFLFLALAAASDTFQPYYFGQVIDSIAIKQDENAFFQAIVIISGLALISSLGAGLRGMCFLISMARLNIRIRNCLFGSLVKQEIGFFDTTKTGSVTSRLTSDTTKMSDQLSLNLNIFLRSAARAVGSLVFMFSLSWKLTVVVLLQVPVIALITHYYGKYYKKLSKAVQSSLAKANNVADEVLSSMRTVRSFANELRECDRYSVKLKATFRLNVKQAVAYFGYQSTNRGLELMSDVALLYYGGWLVLHTEVTAGHLVSFILYAEELGGAVEDIGSVFTGLMQAVGAADKVFTLIDRKPKIDHYEGSAKPETLRGRIEFRNVSFAYPSRPDSLVLKNVSFRAEPGDVIALVGVSGGGKTSCISLLQRFYDPVSGSVLIDSRPLPSYDHKFLHTKMSMVGQEPVLYASTVEDNIAYGMDNTDRDTVIAAAQIANAHNFIDAMSKGYKTQTGEKGVQLSGGQKQRLAIARAVIRDPAILLLDEATSALDAESEHLVQDGLYRKMKDKTVLVVAHRLSTVENATKIVVIDKGIVVEQGTHQDLLRIGGLYAKLVQRQLMPAKQNQNLSDILADSEQMVNTSPQHHHSLQRSETNSDSDREETSSGSVNL